MSTFKEGIMEGKVSFLEVSDFLKKGIAYVKTHKGTFMHDFFGMTSEQFDTLLNKGFFKEDNVYYCDFSDAGKLSGKRKK
ncbi:hypothetical protein M0R19_03215 [Candidatus Pacearchaeota archaeon]|nr:hypothetical protein [Candidatus Pacearchaeota archaeon]